MPTVEDRRVLDVSLDRAWRIAKNSHELLPQLMPEIFESIDLEEGDGGPGSIFVLTMGPGTYGSFLSLQAVVDLSMFETKCHHLSKNSSRK